MEQILEVEHLSLTFVQYASGLRRRALQVLDDLSLTVAAGQVVAVVGASGSGKSLLAHGILGILPYNARMGGALRYRGAPLDEARAKTLRGREIVLVPQGVTWLDPLETVGAQLRRGSRRPAARAASRAALAGYGLGEETERLYPFELSGGMARRVLLAAAAMERPRLVIADEPTPGLDARAAARVLGHFRDLAADGAGVLFITHDLELALTVADRVVVLYAGQTVEETASGDFAAGRLRHPYTRALWAALPRNGFLPLAGTQPYPGEISNGCRFAPRCPRCRPDCRERAPEERAFAGGRVRCHDPEGGDAR